ncbi:MAG: hypothetical protein JXL97_07120 [Bacteroidales bacterium]|nr:hypothetical protein [Bacteroidales bacterium]
MKKKILKISVLILILTLIINSFEFMFKEFKDNLPEISYFLLAGFVIPNLVIVFVLFGFFRRYHLKLQTALLGIIVVGQTIYPIMKFADDYYPSLDLVGVVLLLVLFSAMLTFFISTLFIQTIETIGMIEIKRFSKWFLIAFGISITIIAIVTMTNNNELMTLTQLPFILSYWHMFKFEEIDSNEEKPVANILHK